MKYITVKLTPDQLRFVIYQVEQATVDNPVIQSSVRIGFGLRLLKALGAGREVDHSSSEAIINAKLASGEIKLPKVS